MLEAATKESILALLGGRSAQFAQKAALSRGRGRSLLRRLVALAAAGTLVVSTAAASTAQPIPSGGAATAALANQPPPGGAEWRVFAGGLSAPGQFDSPSGVAVDAQGNLYVADSGNHRIQVLSPTGP